MVSHKQLKMPNDFFNNLCPGLPFPIAASTQAVGSRQTFLVKTRSHSSLLKSTLPLSTQEIGIGSAWSQHIPEIQDLTPHSPLISLHKNETFPIPENGKCRIVVSYGCCPLGCLCNKNTMVITSSLNSEYGNRLDLDSGFVCFDKSYNNLITCSHCQTNTHLAVRFSSGPRKGSPAQGLGSVSYVNWFLISPSPSGF